MHSHHPVWKLLSLDLFIASQVTSSRNAGSTGTSRPSASFSNPLRMRIPSEAPSFQAIASPQPQTSNIQPHLVWGFRYAWEACREQLEGPTLRISEKRQNTLSPKETSSTSLLQDLEPQEFTPLPFGEATQMKQQR